MVKFRASIEAQQPTSDPVMAFTMCLLHSVTNTHILHLTTQSYSEHKALESFYTEIGDLVDSFVEAFQGKYGLLHDFIADYQLPTTNPLDYLTYLKDEVATLRREPNLDRKSTRLNSSHT